MRRCGRGWKCPRCPRWGKWTVGRRAREVEVGMGRELCSLIEAYPDNNIPDVGTPGEIDLSSVTFTVRLDHRIEITYPYRTLRIRLA